MKKFLSLLLAVMMLLGCIPAMADDAEWKINQYTQLVSRKSAAEKLENIVVPAEVDGVAVRGVEYMAFNMYKNFKTLTIADTAVMLDRSVVRDLSKLEAIDLPENLLVIREGNFTNVPMLTSVVIPASVAVVQSSFNSCKSLKSITFEGMCPVFVTEGTYGMFADLPADCVIYVPDNQVDAYKAAFADHEDVVARIQPSGQYASAIDWTAPEGDFVFDAATGTITGYTGAANYLKIPATIGGVEVKHIANDAFVKCHSLCCVVIPEGVETVGEWAFAGISLLSYVSLPSTLVTMGDRAFSSAYMSAIAFGGNAVPTFDASAFSGFKGDWQLILPYGSSQEFVDAFAAYLAPAAATGVVKASLVEPYKFPTLDAEAGAPFIGNWFSVAGKDVMGDFTDYYPATIATLNADGTGMINMDGDEMAIAWFVNSGYAIIAPRAEDGSAYEDQAFAYANIDENGRLYVDFGYIGAICEQEGATYAAPARPEKSWPDFDLSNAKYFIGQWEATEYIVEGESYPVELIGPMAVTLNDDGSALLVEGEEEPYELRWYAEYAVAYMGENMSDRVEITFDGNGNIKLDMIDVVVILAPKAAVKVITGADELLGDWYDDLGNKLTLANDGTMTYTYASDGWTYEEKWDVVDGAAVVTEGRWEGADIYTRDGIVFIDNDAGIFQLFSVDGDLSAYYGDDDDDLPEAQPIGAEGEPYFGTWQGNMFGLEVALTLNQDGTCAMEMMGEAEPGVWSVVDGKANVMDDEYYIDGDGNLVAGELGIVFTKVGGAAASGPETALGTWEDKYKNLYVNEDGTIELVYKSDGYTSRMKWEVVNGDAIVMDGLWKNMPLTAENGVLTLTDGSYVAEFTRVGDAPAMYVGLGMGAAPAAPTAPDAPVGSQITYVPSVADDFIGGWICTSDPNLQILLLDGEANLIDGGELYTVTWSVVDGVAEFDGMKLYITEDYTVGLLDMYGDLVEFERGYVEKPKASAAAPAESDDDDDDEMTEEELLAFLALLAQMAENELPEELQPYAGTWYMCYVSTGGLSGDLRTMGITGQLMLLTDGTGELSGLADEEGTWGEVDGIVCFGEDNTPLELLKDADGELNGFLRYGSELAGYMIFSQDEDAVWTPAPAATAAPAAPVAPVTGNVTHVGQKFVCKTYTTFGQTMDASMLGAEYSLQFHETGMADFTMSGFTVPNLPYTVTAEGVYAINYYGTMFNCVPTDTGFDMDYYGTMTMHFVPAE